MKTFNLNSDEWDGTRDREGWRCKGALVGERIGGELIGATMSEVAPGSRLWPYHAHYLNEVPRALPERGMGDRAPRRADAAHARG
jgi:hypothetical protein